MNAELSKKKKNNRETPMIKQYLDIKNNYKDTVLFYRVGDFYETFFDDAKTTSKVLNIALTSRGIDASGKKVPLAGIPYHAVDSYLYKMVAAGYKVGICEQIEDPKLAKGVVKRDVIRVVTPGTIVDDKAIDEKSNNNILSFFISDSLFYYSFCDVSTGEFHFSEIESGNDFRKFLSELLKISPKEIIVFEEYYRDYLENKNSIIKEIKKFFPNITINYVEKWKTVLSYNENILKDHLNVINLKSYGFEKNEEIITTGILLSYLQETQKSELSHIERITPQRNLDFMFLDLYTQLNLDLLPDSANKNANLFYILDTTNTPMGARLLKNRILQPLTDPEKIGRRLDIIDEFFALATFSIEKILDKIKDIERIISKISIGIIKPGEFNVLKEGLGAIPDISDFASKLKSSYGMDLYRQFMGIKKNVKTVFKKIEEAISENPPFASNEIGIFKDGYNKELDEIRNISKNGKKIIKEHFEKIKEKIGSQNIKLGYNKVFGYYFEITKAKLNEVKLPEEAIRKQTLVNSERFITVELKEIEEKILSVNDRLLAFERQLWNDFLDCFKPFYNSLMVYSRIIAELDYFISMKNNAIRYNYTRPVVNNGDLIRLKGSRHPVIEQQELGEPFIPNDITIDNQESQIQLITGPNMAGKSTFLRQVALIILMAQMGTYVPADEAYIGAVDRIFTRIGASDNLALGQSTFMVEMNEVANILNSATDKSFIILDEVGRGTSTYDGLSIAWAVVEYLHDTEGQRAKTLFATHYHELTKIAEYLKRVDVFKVDVEEYGDKIIFLRKVIKGSADKSYGIYVGELAGLPKEVIKRAEEILVDLEANSSEKIILKKRINYVQPSLFVMDGITKAEKYIIEEIKALEVNNITPMDSLAILNKFKKSLKKNEN